MSLVLLVVAAALVTYVARATSLVLLPTPQGWLAQMVERLPAPLFAGLAAATLLASGSTSWVPSLPALAAVAGALLVAPRRSLGLALLAGLVGHGVALVVLSALG